MDHRAAEGSLPNWLFFVLSWGVSGYCGVELIRNVGLFPRQPVLPAHSILIFLSLFFLFLPFFRKIKIGKIFELEREVQKTTEDLKEFKAEVRNNLSLISTNVNTISGISTHFTVNIPNTDQIREVREEVERRSDREMVLEQRPDELEELLQREDPTLALAYTRIEIERLLRRILGKRTESSPEELAGIRFASISRLFDKFLAQYGDYKYLQEGFRYLIQICNAAIHGQNVTYDQAQEAASLGRQLILILQAIAKGTD